MMICFFFSVGICLILSCILLFTTSTSFLMSFFEMSIDGLFRSPPSSLARILFFTSSFIYLCVVSLSPAHSTSLALSYLSFLLFSLFSSSLSLSHTHRQIDTDTDTDTDKYIETHSIDTLFLFPLYSFVAKPNLLFVSLSLSLFYKHHPRPLSCPSIFSLYPSFSLRSTLLSFYLIRVLGKRRRVAGKGQPSLFPVA